MPIEDALPFALPFVGKEEEEAAIRVLRSGWLTTGKETLAFEKEFGEFLQDHSASAGSSNSPLFCLAVNSATSGLHLALEACGINSGHMVLVPTLTFTSTAEVIRYLGAEAIFVDVAPGTFHMDPKALERTLKMLPLGIAKAVMPVHYGGLVCDMESISAIAKKYHLKIIEDAAHSFPMGEITGDAAVFSFYATKTMTTGEGGMVVTRNAEMAARMSRMRSHGIDRTVWNRYTDAKASWYYEVTAPGFKYNIPDILSAIGRAQLAKADDMLRMREAIAAFYNEAFAEDPHFTLPPKGGAWHLYPIRINPERLSITRNEFIEKLQEKGIGVSVHFIPLHTMPYYKKRYNLADEMYPHAFESYSREISLPIWAGMSKKQIERVAEVVKETALEYTL
ncbi:DegT/DnrJ/EryC1/StrS family aminotransferase [Leadbettera azotonutricia]|uniref:UDP-4-amino-4-deoxy-L-arabinose--oxoglutarate aminotransferase n=1 Tax=Leadbettera azotonutricia (strain ATCC BAA-888 / DSM 13862 / ZAS-9) TaxID=545695 RepID=F5YAW8_LEAAZ|nr:DegT/DnrJ/EryC1/StrS aminotransferase family protein [Leadbettera azotonutricia]AEF80769.1 UDP-4-amino-4-deoxy-L-arabinose--oxoglutarate aminotransferase [Leadbettera azotonutricia ZAS-9]